MSDLNGTFPWQNLNDKLDVVDLLQNISYYIDNHINMKNVNDKLSFLPRQHRSLVQDGTIL